MVSHASAAWLQIVTEAKSLRPEKSQSHAVAECSLVSHSSAAYCRSKQRRNQEVTVARGC
eukprot:3829739-Rhodomonas_salina.1